MVSNIVPEDRRDLVQDIRDEHISLIGVGEARVVETGEAGVFGRDPQACVLQKQNFSSKTELSLFCSIPHPDSSRPSILLELFVFPKSNLGTSSR